VYVYSCTRREIRTFVRSKQGTVIMYESTFESTKVLYLYFRRYPSSTTVITFFVVPSSRESRRFDAHKGCGQPRCAISASFLCLAGFRHVTGFVAALGWLPIFSPCSLLWPPPKLICLMTSFFSASLKRVLRAFVIGNHDKPDG
jgi:hypothetical protein